MIEWEQFVAETKRPLSGTLYKQGVPVDDIEDVCQDAYLRLFEKGEIESPKAFLFTVARNRAIDLHRRSRPIPERAHLHPSPSHVEDEAIDTVIAGELTEWLLDLGEESVIYKAQGYTDPEIAERQGVKPNALRQQLYRTRQKLRPIFTEAGR